MRFLKKPEEPEKKIEVTKLIELSMECLACHSFQKMKGGPTNDNKASFECPECGFINTIGWNIDI